MGVVAGRCMILPSAFPGIAGETGLLPSQSVTVHDHLQAWEFCSTCLMGSRQGGVRPEPQQGSTSGASEGQPRGLKGWSKRPKSQQRGKECYAWNDGQCSLPYCRFDHVCQRCYGNHRKGVCSGRIDGGDGDATGAKTPDKEDREGMKGRDP